jgi:hypothetical protein
MKLKKVALFAALLLFSITSLNAASKLVMVYYMPWFTAKPYSSGWGWHWTMDHFNPDQINAAGQREIASWYYPLIGPYDSSDPAVLEYHVLLMKLAGIDGVIVDWYGSANFLDYALNNEATVKLFQFTRKAGLKFAVCFEDQTIQHMLDGKFIVASNTITHAQHEMQYLEKTFFSDPSYLRLNDRPVLLNFGPQFFMTNSDWENIFSVLSSSNRLAFFTEDNRLPCSIGAFSWPPMWKSQAPGTGGVLSGAALKSYLAEFEQKAAAWPGYISSAFPRFHDIYQRAGVRNYWGYLGDRHSETFQETLTRGMTNSSRIVQIITWNDFGEGTVVEPTQEYGYRDLELIQSFRRKYVQPDFSGTTNDLSIALSVFNLRRGKGTNLAIANDLDQIFATIAAGRTAAAKTRLENLTNDPGKPAEHKKL